MIESISPPAEKRRAIPDFVLQAVNELLTEKFTANKAIIKQQEIIDKIYQLGDPDVTRELIFSRGWLNFEEIYRAKGWDVKYDKPGYNESYFEFRS